MSTDSTNRAVSRARRTAERTRGHVVIPHQLKVLCALPAGKGLGALYPFSATVTILQGGI